MFTMAVDAWAKSSEGAKAAQRAEAILQHMHELYQSGRHDNLQPTTGIFNAVINAWAKSRHPKAAVYAENLLIRMIKAYQSDPFSTVKPDAITFSSVLNALAKSKAAGKGKDIFRLSYII